MKAQGKFFHSKVISIQAMRSTLRKLNADPHVHPVSEEPMSEDFKDRDIIAFVESRLKSLHCEEYSFGQRYVFKKKEPVEGSLLLHGTNHYSWPTEHKHTKARDSHPDLNECFPVPDNSECWLENKELFSYIPLFTLPMDSKDTTLMDGLNSKNLYGRSSNHTISLSADCMQTWFFISVFFTGLV